MSEHFIWSTSFDMTRCELTAVKNSIHGLAVVGKNDQCIRMREANCYALPTLTSKLHQIQCVASF